MQQTCVYIANSGEGRMRKREKKRDCKRGLWMSCIGFNRKKNNEKKNKYTIVCYFLFGFIYLFILFFVLFHLIVSVVDSVVLGKIIQNGRVRREAAGYSDNCFGQLVQIL